MFVFGKKKPKKLLKPQVKPKPPVSAPDKSVPRQSPSAPKPKPKPYAPPIQKPIFPTKPKVEAPAQRRDAEKEFLKTFKRLTYRHRALDIWRDFIVMFACSLSNSLDKTHYDKREALYMKTIRKYNKEEQNLFPNLVADTVLALEFNPEQDFLGKIYMGLGLGNDDKSQYFTPYCVCELMAEVALNTDICREVEENGYITINDPCCGAGATLIAGIHVARKQLAEKNLNFQNHVLVSGQDVDTTVALMCYIQLSLLGVAGYIKVGNSLTNPMCSADTRENYWFTPMYFSDIWITRRMIKKWRSCLVKS